MTDETSGVSAIEPLSIEENEAANNDGNIIESFDTKMSDEETGKEQETPAHSTSASQTRYRDHYSLAYPSSTVRFRSSGKSYRVYEGNRSQFLLEENAGEITVKRVSDRTTGTMFLRAIFTVVTVLWSGFLFVFCTQILIFLVMDLVVYLGERLAAMYQWGEPLEIFFLSPSLHTASLKHSLLLSTL